MSDYGDNMKYKWTSESTTLLVSVWSDKQVQKKLECAERPLIIWESIARYMRKKGYEVSAKQCKSRMKKILVCYQEAKKSGTRVGVEQHYDSIDKVLKIKRRSSTEPNDINSVDTVDSAAVIKSPPKDVKTNKNYTMMFNKYSEPIQSIIRTEALSPTWHLANDGDYPDSPESNETVLVQPYRAFSPTRDAATNTLNSRSQLLAKNVRRSLPNDDHPIKDTRHSLPNNRSRDLLFQNTVQNVQNQIIQENMQQRNLLQNQLLQDEPIMQPEQLYRRNVGHNTFYPIDETVPLKLRPGSQRYDPPVSENLFRTQNQLQQTSMPDNRAVPQEPRRGNFGQNLAMNYKLFKEAPLSGCYFDQNLMRTRQRANYSPDTAANLNDAFCQTSKDEMNENYEENYENPVDQEMIRAMNATTLTNNATFNDDTISIEFLEGSPSPSDNCAVGTKSVSGGSDKVPDAPVRTKKVQKLEQLMISAITSQSEVVNKILAAQDAMVSRFLDLDRDRQNRLENRLDHLMNVVHATVLQKSPEKESDPPLPPPPPPEPLITCLSPPPRPGALPPKLDLVPPKPCRVPCTSANANVELINQNSHQTRPGIVSPIKPPGAIWSKLGPVSQSPFVKAQQQLGLRFAPNPDPRTQSSAERRIAREMESVKMDSRTIIFETEKFLQNEKLVEEKIENARVLTRMTQEVAARRKLFNGEPNVGVILTAAFLDAERFAASVDVPETYDAPGRTSSASGSDEDEELLLLAGQVENYERLRRLNRQARVPDDPCDTSTPAKKTEEPPKVPKQSIQQLAELVMKSARWKDATAINKAKRFAPPSKDLVVSGSNVPNLRNRQSAMENNQEIVKRELIEQRRTLAAEIAEQDSRDRAVGWLQERFYYGLDPRTNDRDYKVPAVSKHPMGFTAENLLRNENSEPPRIFDKRIGFNPDILVTNNYGRRNVAFVDLEAPQTLLEKTGQATYPRQRRQAPAPPQQRQYARDYGNNYDEYSSLPIMHRHMIDRYVRDNRGPLIRKQNDKGENDTDDDDEFLDTTASMQPSRKTSLTSNGTSSGKQVTTTVKESPVAMMLMKGWSTMKSIGGRVSESKSRKPRSVSAKKKSENPESESYSNRYRFSA